MAPFVSHYSTVTGGLKAALRPTVRLLREVPVHRERLWQGGRGPMAVFLPAYGPEGAALLRIYAIAGALRDRGWRTLLLPPRLTLVQRHRLLARATPDIVVMQGARHGLNRPGYYPGQTILFDMDDADFHLPHLAGPLRAAMPRVAGVIAGSRYIADWCLTEGAPRADVLWTGAEVSPGPRPPQAERPPLVAWAQTRPMDYGAEAALVRGVLARLGARLPGVRFRLYDRRPGDDPAFADTFAAPGVTVEWQKNCLYSDYLTALDDVSIGLAPLCPDENPFARGKSFGKVLAYLDRGVPVVASDAGEHGAFFTERTGVISNDPAVWDQGCRDLLLTPALRQGMADRAFQAFRARLSLDVITNSFDRICQSYLPSGQSERRQA